MHRGEHQDDEIRQLIAQEAARLMYEEGVREYRDAKRKAGRRYGTEKALSLGSHLPTGKLGTLPRFLINYLMIDIYQINKRHPSAHCCLGGVIDPFSLYPSQIPHFNRLNPGT